MIQPNPDRLNSDITMNSLVKETGLSERQVRRCIAEGLVESATGKGRAARYSPTTLRTLRLIARLMTQKVKPLDRPLTLAEIKSTLHTLTTAQEEQILAGIPFSFIDTEPDESVPSAPPPVESRLDHEYLDIIETADRNDEPVLEQVQPIMASRALAESPHRQARPRQRRLHTRGTTFYRGELGDLGMLLEMLEENLQSMTDKTKPVDPSSANSWTRVRTRSPIMEIHVKSPADESERARLVALHRAVRRLIRGGYEFDDNEHDLQDD